MTLELVRVEDRKRYNELLSRSINVNLTQTWEYGDAKAKSENLNIIRAAIIKGDVPIAVVQMIVVGNVVSINRGPVVLTNDWRTDNTIAIEAIGCLQNYWVIVRKMHLRICPNVTNERLRAAEVLSRLGFYPSGMAPRSSIRVDLSLSEHSLRRGLRKNWREQLGKSERMGLSLEVVRDDDSFRYLMDQYRKSQMTRGFLGVTDSFVDELRETCSFGQSLDVFFASRNDERIAAMLFAGFFDSYHPIVNWNISEEGRKCYAHNYLYWQGIVHSKLLGYKWLDMGGIDEEKHPSITFFKRGIGGEEYTLMPEYESSPN